MNKIVLLGNPNTGKSTLLNAIIKEPVSIVTNLAGTTRNSVSGYTDNFEIIDTPGMQQKKRDGNLSRHMSKSISASVASADIILYVLDATNFNQSDIDKIENYRNKQPVIVVVNKTDRVTPEKLIPRLAPLGKLDFVRAIVPTSARNGQNLEALISEINKITPAQQQDNSVQHDQDLYTSQSIRQMSAEIIRKHLIQSLQDEIPHSIAVLITKFNETNKTTEIHADILCEKPHHKPIIIGKNGAVLKKVGEQARHEIEQLLDTHVQLYTNVVICKDWKNNKELLDKLGHTAN